MRERERERERVCVCLCVQDKREKRKARLVDDVETGWRSGGDVRRTLTNNGEYLINQWWFTPNVRG